MMMMIMAKAFKLLILILNFQCTHASAILKGAHNNDHVYR